jgi:hypothetical protein
MKQAALLERHQRLAPGALEAVAAEVHRAAAAGRRRAPSILIRRTDAGRAGPE